MAQPEDSGEAQEGWTKILTLAKELEESYWVPLLRPQLERFDEVLVDSERYFPELHLPLKSFLANMHSTQDLLDIPYQLFAPLVPNVIKRLHRLNLKEDRPDFEIDGEMDADRMDAAFRLYAKELEKSKIEFERLPALKRLMHQACVLMWSSFEVYSKEILTLVLNKNPSLFGVVQSRPRLKDRFGVGSSSWSSLLEQHNYDLTGKLGTIVVSGKDLSSPELLRELFPAIFESLVKDSTLLGAFNSESFWLLGHRRHLIAHRCGVVDQHYLDRVEDDQELGSILKVNGRQLVEAMSTLTSCALGMYIGARKCWKPEAFE